MLATTGSIAHVASSVEQHPALSIPPTQKITWKSLSQAQQKYAKQLHEDEGWSMREAVILAFEEVRS